MNAAKCATCGQVNRGQTGEYPCAECGVPTLWDDACDPVTGTPYAAESHSPEEFARMQELPLIPGHALGCTCWQCGQEWLRANLEAAASSIPCGTKTES